MADTSDERTWWSSLFPDGADPGVEVPDDVWDSVVTTVLAPDAPAPSDDLMPDDRSGMDFDAHDEPSIHYDVHHAFDHDDSFAHHASPEEAFHVNGEHEVFYAGDDASDDEP